MREEVFQAETLLGRADLNFKTVNRRKNLFDSLAYDWRDPLCFVLHMRDSRFHGFEKNHSTAWRYVFKYISVFVRQDETIAPFAFIDSINLALDAITTRSLDLADLTVQLYFCRHYFHFFAFRGRLDAPLQLVDLLA